MPENTVSDSREPFCPKCCRMKLTCMDAEPKPIHEYSCDDCGLVFLAPNIFWPVEKPVSNVDNTLAERGARYGAFGGHACITQKLKRAMHNHDRNKGWDRLNASQKEALEMIVHKIGRILNGDPNYADSWHDIAGYAKLVEDEINAKR